MKNQWQDFGFLSDPVQRQLFFEKIGAAGAGIVKSSNTYSRTPSNPLAAGFEALGQQGGPERESGLRLHAEKLRAVQEDRKRREKFGSLFGEGSTTGGPPGVGSGLPTSEIGPRVGNVGLGVPPSGVGKKLGRVPPKFAKMGVTPAQFAAGQAVWTATNDPKAAISAMLKPAKETGFTLGQGQTRYDSSGRPIAAGLSPKPPATKFANVDYPKGVTGPSMIDLNDEAAVAQAIAKDGKITSRQATGTPDQLERGKRAQNETIKQVVPLIDDATKSINDAAGLIPAARELMGNVLGQFPEGGVNVPGLGRIETGKGAIAGEVVDARQKVAILREQMIKAFRKSGRVNAQEQKRLLALVDTSIFTAPETARRNLEVIKKFFQDTFQRNTGRPLESSAPPRSPQDRKPGATYNTPRGPMKWTGTGWLPAN